MADGNTTVTVFVDDAVQGRFPRVCARTGRPSDGWLTVDENVARSSKMSTPLLAVLLLAGPIGWAAIVLFSPHTSDLLTVRVPWSADVHARIVDLRRGRRAAWAAAALAGVALVATLVSGAGGPTMLAQVVLVTLALATAGAVVAALVTEHRIGRLSVGVDLDASRRWVTLRNVHPHFAAAASADQRRRRETLR
ncbi:MAG: hypothetical protein JXA83_00505 [Acidimicrobiales bacterium]|nr:hypothetical protein [Acidimicrobiales bacterium]